MSDLSLFIEGKLSPQDFVTKAAVDLKKDLGIFASPLFLNWAVDALAGALTHSGKISPTLVSVVEHELKKALGLTST